MEQAVKHCTQGIGIWQWASTDEGAEPDIVMACCGDTPTLETLAAVTILRGAFPELKIRVVNVVDLMRLQSEEQHPHGLSQRDYDVLFTRDKPIVFAFHGYPCLLYTSLFNMDDITNFLYLIGSVFAPMIAVQLTTYFILKKDSFDSAFNWPNLIVWRCV